ncbi:metallophosphoesterase [Myroides guanonis]|uniref:Calcineurin-like phosphoesterase domain-containing protein n=1 Tax=Myroides guanonis TaxID=1150112 RepID=A0A1I3T0C9_9FLAO|nr:metallophosphoesterase [Myroides guanonis]SFJ63962.1 hypothetical protein SAMN04487893_1128 [Myroides guanonis]
MRWTILLLVFILVEFYSYQALRQLSKNPWLLAGYIVISVAVILYVVYGFLQFDRTLGQNKQSMLAMGLIMLFYLPKLLITLILLVEDAGRLFMGTANYFISDTNVSDSFMPERRKFVSQMALGIAALPFLSIMHGITRGRYKFQVHKQTVFFDDLPDAFDGFKITQISDIHSGSFDNEEKVQYAIDLINEQDSDVIVFTGDLVNSLASEMEPWISVFKGIRPHEYGKYSILGNHDYGEYVQWSSEEDKEANFKAIKDLHPAMDFKLLLNESVWLEKEGERIAIAGVENWGVKFKKVGDLNKSIQDVEESDFKVLLTHDPSHWEAEVLDHPKKIQLTLSGHTHGSQFGIEIPGFLKWSPIQYVYKQWAGLYDKKSKFLYVNRGFGYHAYPGRVGIWPEITVLELRKKV